MALTGIHGSDQPTSVRACHPHFGRGIASDRRAMEHEVHRFHDEDETKEGEGNLLRCTEEAIEPGKKRRHRRNKAGVCLDCGAVSHRAGRLPKLAVEWTCPHCRSEIEWIEQIVDQCKRDLRPGDNFVCVECSGGSVVTADNRLRRMSEAEFLSRRPASQKIIRDAQAGRYSRTRSG
jgi:hypothetical protein